MRVSRRSGWLSSLALVCLVAGRTPGGAAELREINGFKVLTVEGDPEALGRGHGELLGEQVRRVVGDVIVEGEGASDLAGLLSGAMVMEGYLPPEYRAELRALAAAAQVDYAELVALQLFGDVRRAGGCTSYAAFGPATADGSCVIGRNMDYWDHGVSRYAAILLHVKPDRGHAFLTCSWAGITNGWTTLNDAGVFCSNNSGYGRRDTLDGLSTCFLVRKVAQYAGSVEEGIAIVRETPRSVGAILLIAGGDPPDAAICEYDHDELIVRRARDGYVVADNSFQRLGQPVDVPWEPSAYSRAGALLRLIRRHYGRIDRTMNFAAAQGVPIRSINLHSALVFPADRAMYVSMGVVPAADQPYRGYRLTPTGVIGLDIRRDAPESTAEPE